jgi:hypothetical protein
MEIADNSRYIFAIGAKGRQRKWHTEAIGTVLLVTIPHGEF